VVARTTGPSARKAFGATWNGAPSGCGKAMVTSRSFLTWQEALEPLAVGFSASGIEIYSRLKFGKFAVVGGFEDYIPRDLNPLINPNFKTRYAILGAEWHFSKSGYAFFETRLGDSVDATGMDVSDAAAIGFRYDFSWRTPHTQ